MAEYIKQEMTDLHRTGKKQAYYRMKTYRNINAREFITRLTIPGTGLCEGSVKHVIGQIADELAYCMAQGYTVTIDGLGTFKPTLGLEPDKEMDELDGDGTKRNAQSIRVNGVNFKAGKELVRKTDSHCILHRGETSRLKRSPYTPQQRKEKALEYLQGHAFMRISDYMEMTGLGRSAATVELRKWRHTPENDITTSGQGNNMVYVLRKTVE